MEPAVDTHARYTAKRPVPVLPPLYRDGSGGSVGSANLSPLSSGTDSPSGTPQGYPLPPSSQRGTPTMRPAGARSPHLPPLPPDHDRPYGTQGPPQVYPRVSSERPLQGEPPAAYPRFASEAGHYAGEGASSQYGRPMNATYPQSTTLGGGGAGDGLTPLRSPQAYPRMANERAPGLGSITEHGGGGEGYYHEYQDDREYVQDYGDIQERPRGGGGEGGRGRNAGTRQGQGAAYPRFASESPSQQYGDEGGAAAYPRFTSVSAAPPESQGVPKRANGRMPSASGPLPAPALSPGAPAAGQSSRSPPVPYDINFLKGVAARLGSRGSGVGQGEGEEGEEEEEEEGVLQRRYTSGVPGASRGALERGPGEGLTRRASGVPETTSRRDGGLGRSRDDVYGFGERGGARRHPATYAQKEKEGEQEEEEEEEDEEEEVHDGEVYDSDEGVEEEEGDEEGEEGWGYGDEGGLEALEEEGGEEEEEEDEDRTRFSGYRAHSSLAKRLDRNSSRDDLYVMPRRPSTGEEGGQGQGVPVAGHQRRGGHRRKVSKDDMCLRGGGASPWADAGDWGEEEEPVAEAFCVAPGESEEEEEEAEERQKGRLARQATAGHSVQQASLVHLGHSSSSSEDRDKDRGRQHQPRRRSSLDHPAQGAPGGSHKKGSSWQEEGEGGGDREKGGSGDAGASRRPVRRMSVGEERGHELRADQGYTGRPQDERDRAGGREGSQGYAGAQGRDVGPVGGGQGKGPGRGELASGVPRMYPGRSSRVMRRFASSEEDGRGRGMEEYHLHEASWRPESPRGSEGPSHAAARASPREPHRPSSSREDGEYGDVRGSPEAYPAGAREGWGQVRRRFGSEEALGPGGREEGEGRPSSDRQPRGLTRHGSEQEERRGLTRGEMDREREREWERDRERHGSREGGSGRGSWDSGDGSGGSREMDRESEGGVPLGQPRRTTSRDSGPYSPRERDPPRDSPRNEMPRPSSRDALNDPSSPRQGPGAGAPAVRRAPTRGLTRFASEGEEALRSLAALPKHEGAHRGYPPRECSDPGREGSSHRGDNNSHTNSSSSTAGIGARNGGGTGVNQRALQQFRSMEEREDYGRGAPARDPRGPEPSSSLTDRPGSGSAGGWQREREEREREERKREDRQREERQRDDWQREDKQREERQGTRGLRDERPGSAAGWQKERSVAYPDDRLSLRDTLEAGAQGRGGYTTGAPWRGEEPSRGVPSKGGPSASDTLHRGASIDNSMNATTGPGHVNGLAGIDLPKLGLPATPGPLLAAALKERAQALAAGEGVPKGGAGGGGPKKLVRSMSDDSRAEILALQRFHDSRLKGGGTNDPDSGTKGAGARGVGRKGRAGSPEQPRGGGVNGGTGAPRAKATVVRAQADVAKEFQRMGLGGGGAGVGPKGGAGGAPKKAAAFPGSQSTAPGKPKAKAVGPSGAKPFPAAGLNPLGRAFPGSGSVAPKAKGAAFPGSPSVAGQAKKAAAFPGSTSVAAPKRAAFLGSASVAPKGPGKAFPGSPSVAGQPKKAFPGSSSVAGPASKKPVGDGPLSRMAKGSVFPASPSTAAPSGAPRALPGSKSVAGPKPKAAEVPQRNSASGPVKAKKPK